MFKVLVPMNRAVFTLSFQRLLVATSVKTVHIKYKF